MEWETRKDRFPEDLRLSGECVVSKDVVQYLAIYQLEAIRFIWKHYKTNQGCIYSADSGMGKISTLLAFSSALRVEKILVLCKNPEGIKHWTYQARVFSLPEDLFHFVSLEVLEESRKSDEISYFIIDCRHAEDFTMEEILLIEKVSCKKRILLSSQNFLGNFESLRRVLHCVDRKWLDLLKDTVDILLIISHCQKFLLRHQTRYHSKDLPIRKDELYRKAFEGWQKSQEKSLEVTLDILSQGSDRGISFGNRLRDKLFLSSDSGTPELIFSEEEIIKTSSRIHQPASQDLEDNDLVIPASPVESQPLFRRRPPRRRILSTQISTEPEITQTKLPESNPSPNGEEKSFGRVTPDLFESSESEDERGKEDNKDKSALNTSTPLSKGTPDDFLISQSPILPGKSIPKPRVVDLTGDKTDVFEITTNPTFSNQIKVSKREVSLMESPKTPESAQPIPSTSGKWGTSSRKREQDKCETPRSSIKSTGWLSKVSPKRSQHQRLTPRNLSITFEMRKREEEALRESLERPILTQAAEEGFPRKRLRMKDLLLSSEDNDF